MSAPRCHCGYQFPPIRVQLATSGPPPESLRVIVECPRCGCFEDRAYNLTGERPTNARTVRIATNARGGNA